MSSMRGGLLDNIALAAGVANSAAAASDVNGAVIDTAGYEGVLWLVRFTTPAANNTLKVQQGAVANMSDAADLLGSSVAVGASDEMVAVQVVRPRERYVRVVALRGTTSVIEWGVAILFGPKRRPVVNAVAGTLATESHESPAEGTA